MSQVDDGYGPLPTYQASGVRNIEPDKGGDGPVEVSTPLPSVVGGMILRPNRLGPDGNVELGGMQDPLPTGTWAKNWTSQFRSPLGEFIQPLRLFIAHADVPQMLCSDSFTDTFILLSPFVTPG